MHEASPAHASAHKPRLSFFQIWNMCFGFFGIQIGFGLQNANTSRIFQTLGADIDDLAILWIAAPATGLLVQPIIGFLSDRTWGRFGRRRPYFFIGALLTTAALLIMPHAPALWIAAGALWLMDASINITMEPFRAFVGDQLPDDQRTSGYAMQSFFIGLGAVFASALPWALTNWWGVSNVAAPGVTPDAVRFAFYAGAACLLLAVFWTIFTTKEYSPEELDRFEAAAKSAQDQQIPAQNARAPRAYWISGAAWLAAGILIAGLIYGFGQSKEIYVLAAMVAGFGLAQCAAALIKAKPERANGFTQIIDDLFAMPKTMRQLAIVQFFSWFSLFSMWIYTTSAVTAVHFGATDPSSKAYNDGADWVGVLFAVYNGVAALAALIIPSVAAAIGRRQAHALNLCLGALGFASFFWIRDPAFLLLSMIGVGFAWSSILSAPYAILSSVLPARKMGVYMGVFNIFIVTPQLLAATILALLLNTFFSGQAIYALALGAGAFVCAALATLRVNDPAEYQAGRARA